MPHVRTKQTEFYTENKIATLTALLFFCVTASLSEYCQNRCPAVACPKEGKEDWFQLGQDRCLKAFFFTPHLNFTDAEVMKTNIKLQTVNDDGEGSLKDILFSFLSISEHLCQLWRSSGVNPRRRGAESSSVHHVQTHF